MANVVASTTQSLGAGIGRLIEAASAEGAGVVIRLEGGKAFQPRGTVTIGADYLGFVSEDQDGRTIESIVPLRAVQEVAREVH